MYAITVILKKQCHRTRRMKPNGHRRATSTDKGNDVTVCNHTCNLEPSTNKLNLAKECLASRIRKCDKILVRCHTCHRLIDD
mmetsp:Transcript_12345/g.14111  ORF Transcript_12345/g.14111 Transcript_12345/m.14111 type:complete len:82 (-) Transcript_12345:135-380(-)